MRFVLAFLALFGAAILVSAAPPPTDWTTVVSETPAGAFLIGNPGAKVKLVEYLSYTCPHCADFSDESAPTLKGGMVRGGSTSWEIRNWIRDPLDLSAAVLAHCGGPAKFLSMNEAIFAHQRDWFPPGWNYYQLNEMRLSMYPPAAKLKLLAQRSGLLQLGRDQGLSDAAMDACLSDDALAHQIAAMLADAPAEVTGTPGFFINGKFEKVFGWPPLEPLLRAAGAN